MVRYNCDLYDAFIDHLEKAGFTYIGSGGFRKTYARNKVVIKVPYSQDGVYDNLTEARAWAKFKSKPTKYGIELAPCRLLPNGCLMMVKVERKIDKNIKVPMWANDVDGGQVGQYKNKIVAYDYALDVAERKIWEKEWKVKKSFYSESSYSRRR